MLCIVAGLELGLARFMPAAYQGYLIETAGGQLTWPTGPFEPSQPANAFNDPVTRVKPADTIRIVSVGASGTEGWLSAKAVFNKYGLPWQDKSLSSYSRVTEYLLNATAAPDGRKVEIINLGIAAYNTSDVIRMIKDSMQLDPDMFLLHIGVNETWTGEREKWSRLVSGDIPYFYTELGYEVFTEIRAGWGTLDFGNAFSPLALFRGRPQPIVPEPEGRDTGLDHRLSHYREELAELDRFLQAKGIPALWLIPTQNLADFEPFGSIARPGTDEAQLAELNRLLIEALAEPDPAAARAKLEALLARDDGIAEANYQLGKLYQEAGERDKALAYFWKAADRDIVLKRPPQRFSDATREFLAQRNYPYIDVTALIEEKSPEHLVGYSRVFDDVHPNRAAQYELGAEIVKLIDTHGLLAAAGYRGDPAALPGLAGYDAFTGYDAAAAGDIAFLRGAHNYLAFGRFRQRLRWDPAPERTLRTVLAWLDTANADAASDQSLYLGAVLNLYVGEQGKAARLVEQMGCSASPERAATVRRGLLGLSRQVIGGGPDIGAGLRALLDEKGCTA